MPQVPTYVICPILIVLTSCFTNIHAEPLTLIYSGNLDGELEPCGCTVEGDLGGIKRRASVLDQLRQQQPESVVLSSGGLIVSERVIDRIKSEYILMGVVAIGYDAVGMQWQDLSYGLTFASRFDLPWVLSNGARPGIARERLITRSLNGKRVVLKVFSWLDPENSPMHQMHTGHDLVYDDPERLLDEIRRADRQGHVTILTTSLTLERVQDKFELEAIDILLVKAAYERFAEPRQVGKTLVLQPGSRGKHVARVDLNVDGRGDIGHWKQSVISMPPSVPDAPRMNAWYDEYNAKLEQDYLKRVEIRKQREKGDSDFSGQAACKACHPKQHDSWLNSAHAGAYERLEAVNKAYDPNCIVCHSVGFNKPGGFLDKLITPHLVGVQCESCHGPGTAHVQSAGRHPVANQLWSKEQMCNQCHVKDHSPSFSLDSYWPRITH